MGEESGSFLILPALRQLVRIMEAQELTNKQVDVLLTGLNFSRAVPTFLEALRYING